MCEAKRGKRSSDISASRAQLPPAVYGEIPSSTSSHIRLLCKVCQDTVHCESIGLWGQSSHSVLFSGVLFVEISHDTYHFLLHQRYGGTGWHRMAHFWNKHCRTNSTAPATWCSFYCAQYDSTLKTHDVDKRTSDFQILNFQCYKICSGAAFIHKSALENGYSDLKSDWLRHIRSGSNLQYTTRLWLHHNNLILYLCGRF